jgi:hypothetical protein
LTVGNQGFTLNYLNDPGDGSPGDLPTSTWAWTLNAEVVQTSEAPNTAATGFQVAVQSGTAFLGNSALSPNNCSNASGDDPIPSNVTVLVQPFPASPPTPLQWIAGSANQVIQPGPPPHTVSSGIGLMNTAMSFSNLTPNIGTLPVTNSYFDPSWGPGFYVIYVSYQLADVCSQATMSGNATGTYQAYTIPFTVAQ